MSDGDRWWQIEEAIVSEKMIVTFGQRGSGVFLVCAIHSRDAWCAHRQQVVTEALDAPLLALSDESTWIELPIQPSIGFTVPCLLQREDLGDTYTADTFIATVWDEVNQNWNDTSRPLLDLGSFYPSDGRISLRAMFIAQLDLVDGVECTALNVHPFNTSRKPKNLHEKWQFFVNGNRCAHCAVLTDTSEDVPEL